ncbi:MAG: UDP-3-O-acyl-N-acetylglucosamine deacetylase [Alphaproteobacteria bacterium]|nr:UDP-3-O-acyl-N-acetylglucosamine deacetylase [Alphaproteobacteria bacterium]
MAIVTRSQPLGATVVRQRTLKAPIPCRGVGLHSGALVAMTLVPAPADHGIVFHRTDVTDRDPIIPARFDRVVDTRLCTMIGNDDGVTVGTVEHLMAALAGCGIDNALITLDGPEVPIMDGSSEPFVFLVDCAGTVALDAPRHAIEIRKPITVEAGSRRVTLSPARRYEINFTIDFDNPVIQRSELDVHLVNGTFKHELASARTFGFLEEVEMLRGMGLARGGSLENAIVLDGDKVLNEEGLRFEDEFVRHKVLDCIGDLYLAGAPLIGRVSAVKAGHQLNNAVLHALFADPSAYAMVEMDDAMMTAGDDAYEAVAATA